MTAPQTRSPGWRRHLGWALDRFAGSCAIVTAGRPGDDAGAAVGSLMVLGAADPLVAAGLSAESRTGRLAAQQGRLAVHLIAAEDLEMAGVFGAPATEGASKFDSVSWWRAKTGTPLIRRCVALVEAEVVTAVHAHRFQVLVARPEGALVFDRNRPVLTMHEVRRRGLEPSWESLGED